MDFEFNGIKYFVHRYYKKYYHKANYVYLKDGDLLFIDYNNKKLEDTINLFKSVINKV